MVDFNKHLKKPAIDITEDLAPTGDVTKVIAKAKEMFKMELEIKLMQQQLAEKEEQYRVLSTETMPALMKAENVDVSGVNLQDGYRLTCDPVFRANLPAESTIEKAKDDEERAALEERREQGLTWLRKNKGEDLIKNELKFNLGKGTSAFSRALLAAVKKLRATEPFKKVDVVTSQKESVHQGSLSKYLREKIENGVSVPVETFAIFDGRVAKISAPTKKGAKA